MSLARYAAKLAAMLGSDGKVPFSALAATPVNKAGDTMSGSLIQQAASAKTYGYSGGVNGAIVTPGTTAGELQLKAYASGASGGDRNYGAAITFSTHDSVTSAQAGLYFVGDGTYGTKAAIATTDDYSVGSKARLLINQLGRVTLPSQPAFFALKNGTLTEASGERVVGDWSVPAVNVGSRFDATTGRFTADVAGTYLFSFNNMCSGNIAGDMQVRWRKNGSVYAGTNQTAQGGTWMEITVVCIMYLSVGDYAEPVIYSSTGSSQIQCYGGTYTHVSGHLIG